MTRFFTLESPSQLVTRLCAALLPVYLTACVIMPQTAPNADESDPVKAAFVVLGEGGRRIALRPEESSS